MKWACCRNALRQHVVTPLPRCRPSMFQPTTTLTLLQQTYSPTWTPPRTSPVIWHRVVCTQRLTHLPHPPVFLTHSMLAKNTTKLPPASSRFCRRTKNCKISSQFWVLTSCLKKTVLPSVVHGEWNSSSPRTPTLPSSLPVSKAPPFR